MQPLNHLLLSSPGRRVRLNGDTFVSGLGTNDVPHQTQVTIEIGRPQAADIFVSCLMVTRNRFLQAQVAVECFLRQTFKRRELVILDGSDDYALKAWLAELDERRIRYVDVRGETPVLGTLRNLSVDAAHGTHVCQWDDDDLSHPARIEAQVAILEKLGTKASILVRELIMFVADGKLGVTDLRPQENSLVSEKEAMPKFPDLVRGEDTPAFEELCRTQPVAYLDQPELYVYMVHGSNTWDQLHMNEMWANTSQRFEGNSLKKTLRRMSASYSIAESLKAVRGDMLDLH